MVNNLKKTAPAREKIITAGTREFAAYGYSGARVDRIAQNAQVNKAMIFYYYSSKENLYRTIIREALSELIKQVRQALMAPSSPERFFEIIPEIYIRFFVKRQEFLRMIGHALILEPESITTMIKEILTEAPLHPAPIIKKTIAAWHRKGLIAETDPVHFILNIIPLCVFSILGKPMVEAFLDVEITNNENFINERILSISNLLKQGMLL